MSLPVSGEQALTFQMDACRLAPGKYFVDAAVTEPGIRVIEEGTHLASFTLHARAIGGHWAYDSRFGVVFPEHSWNTNES